MAATKRKRPATPCAHVETQMVAYMAGERADERLASFWCADCGALIHRYGGAKDSERVVLPRGRG